jgi:hypothetical protein
MTARSASYAGRSVASGSRHVTSSPTGVHVEVEVEAVVVEDVVERGQLLVAERRVRHPTLAVQPRAS